MARVATFQEATIAGRPALVRSQCSVVDAIVDLEGEKWDVDNIDPYGAEKIAGNQLRVRKLPLEEALNKYGHDSHH